MKTMSKRPVVQAVLCRCGVPVLVMCAAAGAQPRPDPMDEPLVTDRPDFTESTETVPAGHLQLESGYTFTYNREGGTRTTDHTAPEMLWRIGLSDHVELRVGWDGYTYTDSLFRGGVGGDSRKRAFQDANDLSLGLKVKLFEQEGWRPHFGIIAAVTVPTGAGGGTSGDVDPEIVFLWAYDLSENTAIAGNVGIAVPTEDSHRFVQTTASLAYAFALTEKWGAYAEYFGIYPSSDSGHDAHFFNAGFTYLVNKDFQLDVRVGLGLNEEAGDFFTGVGLSKRF